MESSDSSRRRRRPSAERPAAKKSKSLDNSGQELVWIRVWPRNQDVDASLDIQLCTDQLRHQSFKYVESSMLSYSVVTAAEYPRVSVTAVCQSSVFNGIAHCLTQAFVNASRRERSDFQWACDTLPPPAPAPDLQWYAVSAPPLHIGYLEQALRSHVGDSPGLQVRQPAASDLVNRQRVLALLPLHVAADLSARGLCMVQAGPGRSEYRIPATVVAVNGPSFDDAPPSPAPQPVTRARCATASRATQTDAPQEVSAAATSDATTQLSAGQPLRRKRRRRRRPAPTVQCYKCQRWGHASAACTSASDVCRLCSGPHRSADCDRRSTIKCANCGSHEHRASSRQCTATLGNSGLCPVPSCV